MVPGPMSTQMGRLTKMAAYGVSLAPFAGGTLCNKKRLSDTIMEHCGVTNCITLYL
jgi:hypothetical protein